MSACCPPPAILSTLREAITHATSVVFGVMLHRPIRLVETAAVVPPSPADAKQLVIGNVGFVGKLNGVVYLCFPETFTHEAAAHVLGMSAGEVEMGGPDLIKDVVGELTNMTVGGFKNTLADLGYPCRLTLPVIMRGHHVAVAAIKSAHREIYHFESGGYRITADIQIAPE